VAGVSAYIADYVGFTLGFTFIMIFRAEIWCVLITTSLLLASTGILIALLVFTVSQHATRIASVECMGQLCRCVEWMVAKPIPAMYRPECDA
jgi:hypothetical protein